MYKHECFKIFTRKSIYVVFLFIVLIMFYAHRMPADYVMKDPVYEDLYEQLGGPITEEKEEYVREQMEASDAGEKRSITEADRAAGEVHWLVAISGTHYSELKEQKTALKENLQHGDPKSAAYKTAEKELNMLEKLGNPYGFYIIQGWNGMFSLIEPFFSVIFIALMIILGLSPIFADEHTQKMTGLLFATKHGKRKLVTAKIGAAFTYIGISFLALHVVNLIFQVRTYGGLRGWDAPMQTLITYPENFQQSPFPWDVWQFYAITLTVQFLGSLALGILVLLISLWTKNSMVTFLISGVVLGFPAVLNQLGGGIKFLEYLSSFSYMELIRVERLFDAFKTYTVFGQPVLYPNLLLIVMAILTCFLVWLIYDRHRRQDVTY